MESRSAPRTTGDAPSLGWATAYIAKLKNVLCKVNGSEYLHLVKAIRGPQCQIGNNRGRINGWIGARGIYVCLVKVEP